MQAGLPVPGNSEMGGKGLVATRSYALGEAVLDEWPSLTTVHESAPTATWELTQALLEPAHAELGAWVEAEFAHNPQIFVRNGNPHAWDAADVEYCGLLASLMGLSERYVKRMYAAVAMINVTASLPGDETHALGIYPLLSYINHSCAPNALLELHGERRILVALQPISAGTEITMPYMHPSMMELPREIRRRFLSDTFGFSCACSECSQ